MRNRVRNSIVSAMAVAVVVIGAMASPASANSNTSSPTSIPGGSLTAYVYIQDWSNLNGCGAFNTYAATSKTVASLTNSVEWDPIGIGASASVKGVGVSVSGNNGASPAASITNTNAKRAAITGTVCASWSTIYLGVFSTGITKISGTLYTASAHV